MTKSAYYTSLGRFLRACSPLQARSLRAWNFARIEEERHESRKKKKERRGEEEQAHKTFRGREVPVNNA